MVKGLPARPHLPAPHHPWPGQPDRSTSAVDERCNFATFTSLLALVKGPASIARYLATVGEATEVPQRSPGRGPPYWKSRVLRSLALAGSNLAAGLGHGFPVSGGMSQSLVNEGGGARTPLFVPVAAGIVLLVTLFLAGLLHDLPQRVLAAIVLMAVAGPLQALRAPAAVALAKLGPSSPWPRPLVGVLGAGLLRGVLIGAVISILLLLRRSVAAAHHRAGPGSRHRLFRRRREAPPQEPAPCLVSSSSAPSPPCSTLTSSTCATASSSCSTRTERG